jgi:hypothetical protein
VEDLRHEPHRWHHRRGGDEPGQRQRQRRYRETSIMTSLAPWKILQLLFETRS